MFHYNELLIYLHLAKRFQQIILEISLPNTLAHLSQLSSNCNLIAIRVRHIFTVILKHLFTIFASLLFEKFIDFFCGQLHDLFKFFITHNISELTSNLLFVYSLSFFDFVFSYHLLSQPINFQICHIKFFNTSSSPLLSQSVFVKWDLLLQFINNQIKIILFSIFTYSCLYVSVLFL